MLFLVQISKLLDEINHDSIESALHIQKTTFEYLFFILNTIEVVFKAFPLHVNQLLFWNESIPTILLTRIERSSDPDLVLVVILLVTCSKPKSNIKEFSELFFHFLFVRFHSLHLSCQKLYSLFKLDCVLFRSFCFDFILALLLFHDRSCFDLITGASCYFSLKLSDLLLHSFTSLMLVHRFEFTLTDLVVHSCSEIQIILPLFENSCKTLESHTHFTWVL